MSPRAGVFAARGHDVDPTSIRVILNGPNAAWFRWTNEEVIFAGCGAACWSDASYARTQAAKLGWCPWSEVDVERIGAVVMRRMVCVCDQCRRCGAEVTHVDVDPPVGDHVEIPGVSGFTKPIETRSGTDLHDERADLLAWIARCRAGDSGRGGSS